MNYLLTQEVYEKFRILIYDSSGIHFTSSNRSILEGRLRERLKAKKLENAFDYYSLVLKNPEELKILLDVVTTNLTKFFRNLPQYEAFAHYVLPDLIKYKNQWALPRRIRLWSAGCSTGEEAYTNAIVLSEGLPPGWTFEVIASDLSLESLRTAEEGWYSADRCQDIKPHLLDRYFTPEGTGYRVNTNLKKSVAFDYHNLKYESGRHNFDIIFCRNVLIYFDEAAQKAVIDKFYKAMTDHSFLFLGHTESLFDFNSPFQFVKTQWVPLYGKMAHHKGLQ